MAAVGLGTAIPSGAPAHATGLPGGCTDTTSEAHEITLPYPGDTTGDPIHGFVALPEGEPAGIVAFTHGYGHTATSWKHHITRTAAELGVIAYALDYRGLEVLPPAEEGGLPRSRGWDVQAGADDTIYVGTLLAEQCPMASYNTIFGVSMGGNTAGLVVAAKPQAPEGGPLFDRWVQVEGASNVIETYLSARALAPVNATAANAKADIEREMGGPIESDPEPYRGRSIVARADDVAASGVDGVVVIHGLDDGLVPPNQSRELAESLRARGMEVDFRTMARRTPESEKDTTITGYVAGEIDKGYVSPLAGHASEKSTTNIVMVTAFQRLADLYAGGDVCDGEHVVDQGVTTTLAGGC